MAIDYTKLDRNIDINKLLQNRIDLSNDFKMNTNIPMYQINKKLNLSHNRPLNKYEASLFDDDNLNDILMHEKEKNSDENIEISDEDKEYVKRLLNRESVIHESIINKEKYGEDSIKSLLDRGDKLQEGKAFIKEQTSTAYIIAQGDYKWNKYFKEQKEKSIKEEEKIITDKKIIEEEELKNKEKYGDPSLNFENNDSKGFAQTITGAKPLDRRTINKDIEIIDGFSINDRFTNLALLNFAKKFDLEINSITLFSELISYFSAIETGNTNNINTNSEGGQGLFGIRNIDSWNLLSSLNKDNANNDPNYIGPDISSTLYQSNGNVAEIDMPLDLQKALLVTKINIVSNPELIEKINNADFTAIKELYNLLYPVNENATVEEKRIREENYNKIMKNFGNPNVKYVGVNPALLSSKSFLVEGLNKTELGKKVIDKIGGQGPVTIVNTAFDNSLFGKATNFTKAVNNGVNANDAYKEAFHYNGGTIPKKTIQTAMTFALDFPAYIIAGVGTAFLTKNPVITWGTALAVPETLRYALDAAYFDNQEVATPKDFIDNLLSSRSAATFSKNFIIGGATGYANKLSYAFKRSAFFRANSEILVFAGVESVLEQSLPTLEEFTFVATMIYGIELAPAGLRKLRNIWKKQNITPKTVLKMLNDNPTFVEDIMDTTKDTISLQQSVDKAYYDHMEDAGINLRKTIDFNDIEGSWRIGEDISDINNNIEGKILSQKINKNDEIVYEIETTNGNKVELKEIDTHKSILNKNEEIIIDQDSIIIKEKKINFNEQKGEIFLPYVEEYRDVANIDKKYKENFEDNIIESIIKPVRKNGELEYNNGILKTNEIIIKNKNVIGTDDFFIDINAYPAQSNIINKYFKNKNLIINNKKYNINKNFAGITNTLSDRVDEVFKITSEELYKPDLIVLKSNEKYIAVPQVIYEPLKQFTYYEDKLLKKAKAVFYLTDDNILYALNIFETKVIFANRVPEVTGEIKEQADIYYNNVIPQKDKIFPATKKIGDENGKIDEIEFGLTWKNFYNHEQGLGLYELFLLSEALMTNTPILRNIKSRDGFITLGRFNHKNKKDLKIEINKAIQSNPAQVAKTLAHEIGHLIDYIAIGNPALKGTNLLGKLAALKGHLNDFIGGKGGKVFTQEDINLIKKDAEEQARINIKNTNKEIKNDLGITPESILNIFRDSRLRETINKEFYNLFVSLDDALKKLIAKDAIKGMLNKHVDVLINKINKKSNVKDDDINIAIQKEAEIIFANNLENEIRKRNLTGNNEIIEELKILSQKWNPFNRNQDIEFTKYRDLPQELMAEFMMSFLLKPRWTSINAPKSFQLFQSYMSDRKEVELAYRKIQNHLTSGSETKYRNLFQNLTDTFEDTRINLYNASQDLWKPNYRDPETINFIDGASWLLRRNNEFEPFLYGKIPRGKRFRDKEFEESNEYLEDYRNSNTNINLYLDVQNATIINQLENNGYNTAQLGTHLLLRNLAESEQRINVGTMKGLHKRYKEYVDSDGSEVSKILNNKDFNAEDAYLAHRNEHPFLDDLANRFYINRQEYVIPLLKESGLFDKESMDLIKNNIEYILFNPEIYALKRVEQSGGTRTVSNTVKKGTVGSYQNIANPLLSTIEKDIYLISQSLKNKSIKNIVQLMLNNKEYFQNFESDAMKKHYKIDNWKDRVIEEVKYSKVGGQSLEITKPPRGMEIITYMDNGVFKSYYINKFMADFFNESTDATGDVLREIGRFNNLSKALFTELNPFFMWKNNIKDAERTIRNLKGATLFDLYGFVKNVQIKTKKSKGFGITVSYKEPSRSYAYYYLKALKPTWRSVMKRDAMLLANAERREIRLSLDNTVDPIERLKIENDKRKAQGINSQLTLQDLEDTINPEDMEYEDLIIYLEKIGALPSISDYRGAKNIYSIESDGSKLTSETFDKKIIDPIQQKKFINQKSMTDSSYTKNVWKLFETNIVNPLRKTSRVFDRVNKFTGALYMLAQKDKPSTAKLKDKERGGIGTPNVTARAKLQKSLNNVFLYYNIGIAGIRSDINAAKENPIGWSAKFAAYHLFPRLLMRAAGFGLLGEELRYMESGVPNYDKDNFIIIPFGWTGDTSLVKKDGTPDYKNMGRPIYFVMPTDPNAKLLNSVVQTVFDHVQGTFTKAGKENPNLREYTGLAMDQLAFSLSPLIKTIGSIGMNLSNINPIDTYTGRPMIDKELFEADDYRTDLKMLENLLRKTTGTWGKVTIDAIQTYGFKSNDINEIRNEVSEGLIANLAVTTENIPFIKELVGMHLQIGNDIGENEIYEDRKRLNKILAREQVTINSAVNKTLKGQKMSKNEIAVITLNSRNAKIFIKKIKSKFIKINTNTIEGILLSDQTSTISKAQALNSYINLTNKLENN